MRTPASRRSAKEFTKKVDAERFLATTRADMARGDRINPADAKRMFADVAEHWRTTRVHADTTAAAVAGDLRNHILPAFSDQEIGRIRHSDIQAWVRRLSKRLAPTTVDRSYRWLAAIFRPLLIHKGISVKAVQEALGHKTATETLNTYAHLWPDDAGLTRRAVDVVLGPCVAARHVAER